MKSTLSAVAIALAGALGFAAAPALAQQGEAPAIEASELSDQKLGSFVEAAGAIRQVMNDFRPDMEAVETEEDRAALRQRINDRIVETVENTPGITLDEYVQIARAARQDEDLETRIRDMMQNG